MSKKTLLVIVITILVAAAFPILGWRMHKYSFSDIMTLKETEENTISCEYYEGAKEEKGRKPAAVLNSAAGEKEYREILKILKKTQYQKDMRNSVSKLAGEDGIMEYDIMADLKITWGEGRKDCLSLRVLNDNTVIVRVYSDKKFMYLHPVNENFCQEIFNCIRHSATEE